MYWAKKSVGDGSRQTAEINCELQHETQKGVIYGEDVVAVKQE